MLSTPASIISSKNWRTLLGSAPSNRVVLVVTGKPAWMASRIPSRAISNPPSRQTEKSWCSFCPSMWTEKLRYLLAFNNLVDLRMHQRLAAGDGDHRRAALVHRFETLFRSEVTFQDVGWVLNLAAARARQIAAEQWLQHQHQWIALPAGNLLPLAVRRHRPHLGYRNCHYASGWSFYDTGFESGKGQCGVSL